MNTWEELCKGTIIQYIGDCSTYFTYGRLYKIEKITELCNEKMILVKDNCLDIHYISKGYFLKKFKVK